MESRQDEQLITRYQSLGDLRALEKLLDGYLHKTYVFFKQMTRCREDAEDLVQESLMRLVQSINTGQKIRNVTNLHFIICRNTAYDFLRRKRMSRRQDSLTDEESVLRVDRNAYAKWMWRRHDHMSCELIDQAVSHCLQNFKDLQKRNIISDYLYGYSMNEIADRNSCSKAMAASYWHRHKADVFACLASFLDQAG